jgi:hypothetical protein
VNILPSDAEPDIIREAVEVVPSASQLHWQQLELTAFFHFGINTLPLKNGVIVSRNRNCSILLILMPTNE